MSEELLKSFRARKLKTKEMLSFEENEWNFKAFKILSTLNLLPIEIDLKTGKIQRQTNKKRIFMWKIFFGIGIFHWFYMFLRLFQSTILEPEKYFRWDHFILHVPFALGYAVFDLTGFCMFVKNPRECEIIFNQLFVERENPVQKIIDEELEIQKIRKNAREEKRREKSSGAKMKSPSPSPSPSGQFEGQTKTSEPSPPKVIRPLFAWPPKYSLDELLARIFSFALLMLTSATLVVVAADPSRPQLLYSALPPKYQNVGSFLSLLAVDAISLTTIAAISMFSIVTQLLFFGKCQLELQRLNLQLKDLNEKFQSRPVRNRDVQKEMWILRQIFSEMRELILFNELFNRCFPFCIFAFKILCLCGSVLFYFFTIRHFHEFPWLAVFTGFAAVVATLVYSILYQRAFSIPEKMKRLKNRFLLTAQKTASNPAAQNLGLRAEMKREIRRVRIMGMKVGSFHTLERKTTPKFIDFVVKRVVKLLVTFP